MVSWYRSIEPHPVLLGYMSKGNDVSPRMELLIWYICGARKCTANTSPAFIRIEIGYMFVYVTNIESTWALLPDLKR